MNLRPVTTPDRGSIETREARKVQLQIRCRDETEDAAISTCSHLYVSSDYILLYLEKQDVQHLDCSTHLANRKGSH